MFKFASNSEDGGDKKKESSSGMFGNMMGKIQASADKLMDTAPQTGDSTSGGQPAGFLDRMNSTVHGYGATLKGKLAAQEEHSHSHTHGVDQCSDGAHDASAHRFQSFAPQRTGNQVKWYVDGCSYFWAVSVALEHAKDSIWILDWWLSPEVYMRRPPAKNEQYRLDRLLRNAAERGVKVKIIVYKEVTQALALSSSHTKHALEDLHPNITVFRHPNHIPDRQVLAKNLMHSLTNLNLTASAASKMSGDTRKAIYGSDDDTVLYWAHHEKLCIVDGSLTFMGGLDLCYGRWDTHDHPIADVHPGDSRENVFTGQEYNNARIMDFQDVVHFENNKLDRNYNSRMGWSDVTVSLLGPVVEDLKAHFAQRWNYIHKEKYDVRNEGDRYQAIDFDASHVGIVAHGGEEFRPEKEHHFRDRLRNEYEEGRSLLANRREQFRQHYYEGRRPAAIPGQTPCQIMRSCCKWSHGGQLEHSIADAYIQTIRESKHFVYIENQFFITATNDKQKPIRNKIGAAIVERIARAHQNNEPYKIIVIIPAVPGFPGDLKADDALATRAIMEFQYFSINRGGYSIHESLAALNIPPEKYIRFYNLRNYDRINTTSSAIDDHDTISACYMSGPSSISSAPWPSDPDAELDAFVSEELYVHTKLLIADDRVVILGSANVNDRSQLGSHDSEIAIRIEDPVTIDSTMAGSPFVASKFAASLRRFIFRKHLGMVPRQDYEAGAEDPNCQPVDAAPVNEYDWGSAEDRAVEDPLGAEFKDLWDGTARTNTDAFEKVFHCVPSDKVRNWKEYDEYFGKHFPTLKEDSKEQEKANEVAGQQGKRPATWKVGHVVKEDFPAGEEGLRQVKDVLGGVRGTLVEMPLRFLEEEDIAKEGMSFNAFTEEVYT